MGHLDDLLARLRYDRSNGEFYWATGTHAGKRAGRTTTHGYRQISFGKRTIHTHILVFYAEHGRLPEGDVDHRDRDKQNNRYWNLREATRSQNCINALAKRTNKLGVRGVHKRKDNGKFRAIVNRLGSRYDCGQYDTVEEAIAAYRTKAQELFPGYIPEVPV